MAERYDQESGQFVCDFISRLPTTDTGKLFNLYDWQRSALMEFYGTQVSETDTKDLPAPASAEWLRKYWYLYLEIPKKNGKSELAAALGLYQGRALYEGSLPEATLLPLCEKYGLLI